MDGTKSIISMQEAADTLQDMFPGKTITVTHSYHSGMCSNNWHYSANVYTVTDGVFDTDYCSSMRPTLADCLNDIRQQVESTYQEAA